jgi:hypothetical protein
MKHSLYTVRFEVWTGQFKVSGTLHHQLVCYDISVAFSDTSSPNGAICCLLFQFPVSSHFLKIIQQLLNIIFIFLSPLSFFHCVLEGSSYTRCYQSSYPSFLLLFVGCFFFPLWLCKYLFIMWLIEFFSILLQHHISTHSKYFVSMLYAFFWVIPQRLNFICWRFGTLSVPSS